VILKSTVIAAVRHTAPIKIGYVQFAFSQTEQELSYRQQIARQLRTQYADGIYMHKYYATSLKSRLSVTQRHWKRNHWIDHTRLDSLLMAAAPTLATQVD